MLKLILEIGREDEDLIHLVRDRDQWQTVLNMVMNLLLP
jgi:hypothetical protein